MFLSFLLLSLLTLNGCSRKGNCTIECHCSSGGSSCTSTTDIGRMTEESCDDNAEHWSEMNGGCNCNCIGQFDED